VYGSLKGLPGSQGRAPMISGSLAKGKVKRSLLAYREGRCSLGKVVTSCCTEGQDSPHRKDPTQKIIARRKKRCNSGLWHHWPPRRRTRIRRIKTNGKKTRRTRGPRSPWIGQNGPGNAQELRSQTEETSLEKKAQAREGRSRAKASPPSGKRHRDGRGVSTTA